jgi:peptidoglycan/LPS O-acetylase OafA/YrhL
VRPTAPKPNYLPTLDGWRAVAIAMVLFAHAPPLHGFLASISPYGALGVDLFFAISGFIITFRLLEEYRLTGTVSLRAFYTRRFFRIVPPTLAFLACLSVLGLAWHFVPLNAGQIAASIFFYRNYYPIPLEQGWYTGHFWSLSVEEHFYLLWPGLLVLALRFRRSAWLAPLLALSVALWRELDLHYGWIAALNPSLRGYEGRSDYRLDGLLWGCVLAFLWQNAAARAWLQRWCGNWTLLAAVVAIAFLLWQVPFGGAAWLAMMFPVLLASTLAEPTAAISKLLQFTPVAWLGRISYSLYIWQQLFLIHNLDSPWGVLQKFPLNIGLALLAATASYYLVEQPVLRWGRSLATRTAEVQAESLLVPVQINRFGGSTAAKQ